MRFSGQIQQNFFYDPLKANGRAGFTALPSLIFVPEPEKPAGAQPMRPT
jgi:hypothetical protein